MSVILPKMIPGTYIRTSEMREKQRITSLKQFANGFPEETKLKIREAMKKRVERDGYWHTEETKRKISIGNSGKIIPQEQRERISKTLKDKELKGEKSLAWKGGCLSYNKSLALKRDNYICQKCGMNDKEVLIVDHIIPVVTNRDLQNDLDNLMTLCGNCHVRKTRKEANSKVWVKGKNKI